VSLTNCPYCSANVTFVRGGSKNRPIATLPYCGFCGWNIPFVEKGVISRWRWTTLGIFGFGILVVAQILALMATHPPIRWQSMAIVVGFAAFWIFAAYGMPRRKYRKDLRELAGLRVAAEANIRAGKLRRSAVPAPDPATVELFDLIRSIPRPRPIRFNPTARFAVYVSRGFAVAYAFGAIRVLLFPFASLGVSQNRLLALALFALAAVLWFAFSTAARGEDRADLMRNGEVALGRVLPREGAKIACEFSDAQGRIVQGRGKNLTGNVQEGMYFPVFYDPQNPADHVALYGSWSEIATQTAVKRVGHS
jgi:hypothetical protein